MKMPSDPIADMLTRIRNAQRAGHETVDIPASKVKKAIAERLNQYGYVGEVELQGEAPRQTLRVGLKYDGSGRGLITHLKRISRPSRRIYVGSKDIPPVLNGLGIAVLSTSKGVLTDREARHENVGGELLCTVY